MNPQTACSNVNFAAVSRRVHAKTNWPRDLWAKTTAVIPSNGREVGGEKRSVCI